MINIRRSDERGHVNWGWLDSYYTFSFGNYYDPEFMGFSKLRVMNEDWINGGGGFDAHPHNDMEIITFVMQGALEHKDNMGNSSVINEGELQKMTAGSGVIHSEYNASENETVHLLQIWIIPDKTGLKPSYQQISIDKEKTGIDLILVAAGNRENNNKIISINQDTDIYLGLLEEGESIKTAFGSERNIWIQLISGSLLLSGKKMDAGDGASVIKEKKINIIAEMKSEFLLFNMN